MLARIVALLLFSSLACSCSDTATQLDKASDDAGFDEKLIEFVGSNENTLADADLDHFFNESKEVQAENANDGATDVLRFSDIADRRSAINPSGEVAVTDDQSIVESIADNSERASFTELDESKDEVVQSITKLNEELVAEINRLKNKNSGPVKIRPLLNHQGEEEIGEIKAKLIKKIEEVNKLKQINLTLEERISRLERSPSPVTLNAPGNYGEPDYSPEGAGIIQNPLNSEDRATCNLSFDAVVTLQSGKNREALYTEFFLLNSSLFDILDSKLEIASFSGLSSYEELWAKARDNPYKFPGVSKRIRSYLLLETSNKRGYRTRTDLNGFGKFENVEPGLYFLAGTASLGTIGVTWNVPVYLREGTNKTSLTLSNASWRE